MLLFFRLQNEQLQQDVEFYRKELEQKDSHQSRDERSEAQKKINKANQQADQYWENWQVSQESKTGCAVWVGGAYTVSAVYELMYEEEGR